MVDGASSLLLKSPLEGVYYPLASGQLKHIPHDWTDKPSYAALLYLAVFGGLWAVLVRKAGLYTGLRVAALISAFVVVSFWVVSWVSADMYDLPLNRWWLVSMIYTNIFFFLFGFFGRGRAEDLYF
jgi:hypothetical protein